MMHKQHSLGKTTTVGIYAFYDLVLGNIVKRFVLNSADASVRSRYPLQEFIGCMLIGVLSKRFGFSCPERCVLCVLLQHTVVQL